MLVTATVADIPAFDVDRGDSSSGARKKSD